MSDPTSVFAAFFADMRRRVLRAAGSRPVHTIAVFAAIGTVAASCARTVRPASRGQERPLDLLMRVEHPDTLAREPMVVEHPDGTLFVAGYGGPLMRPASPTDESRPGWRSRLWQSRDGGASWSQVDVGTAATGVIGNSDVDLAIAPDGTLYFVTMTFNARTLEGERIAIGTSRDVGATWSWTVLSRHRFDDRPWVDVAPDGTAHVIWNDGDGVNHVTSRDRGVTWSTPARVYQHGGSSHLAVGPRGEVAVRLAPASASGHKLEPGINLIAISVDGGRTWSTTPAPAPHAEDGWINFTRPVAPNAVPRWVEPLAWDGAGRLYSLWTDTVGVWLARSTDHGAKWTTWSISVSHAPCYFPYLIARNNGDLAATWLCGKGDAMRWQLARINRFDHDGPPHVTLSALYEQDAWVPRRGVTALVLEHEAGGEYRGLTFLRHGGVGVITTIQRPERGGFTWWRFGDP